MRHIRIVYLPREQQSSPSDKLCSDAAVTATSSKLRQWQRDVISASVRVPPSAAGTKRAVASCVARKICDNLSKVPQCYLNDKVA